MTLARAGEDEEGGERLVVRTSEQAQRLEAKLERIEARLLEGRPHARLLAPMRAAAAGAISFCLLAGAPSCSRSPERPAGETPRTTPATMDGGATASEAAGGEAAEPDGAPAAEPEASAAETTPEPVACSDEQRQADTEALRKRVGEVDPCFSGSVNVMEATPEVRQALSEAEATWPQARGAHRIHADGRVYAYEFRPASAGTWPTIDVCGDGKASREHEERVAEALEGESFPCAGLYGVGVDGGANRELRTMRERLARCDLPRDYGQRDFQIVLDASGAVVDVTGEGESAELRRCLRRVLRGLTFPCLADQRVCPEFVIIE